VAGGGGYDEAGPGGGGRLPREP